VDEAGRGPLAGPVVAGAVVLPPGNPIPDLDDSKLLRPHDRDRLFREITEKAVAVGVGIVPADVIDRINILQASRLAMARAVREILPPPDYLLIDGPIVLDLELPQRSVIKGDRLSRSIAAASIVAKVTRDRIMAELHERYPLYGFDRHKGYGTAEHRAAIQLHGPCPEHRSYFRGVKEFIPEGLLDRDQSGLGFDTSAGVKK